jgi:hypothetical protein
MDLDPEQPPPPPPTPPRHAHEPVDLGYRLVVRTLLWVIVGAVVIALCVWWVLT